MVGVGDADEQTAAIALARSARERGEPARSRGRPLARMRVTRHVATLSPRSLPPSIRATCVTFAGNSFGRCDVRTQSCPPRGRSQRAPQLLLRARVESVEDFVEQQHARVARERARDERQAALSVRQA